MKGTKQLKVGPFTINIVLKRALHKILCFKKGPSKKLFHLKNISFKYFIIFRKERDKMCHEKADVVKGPTIQQYISK